MEPEDYTHKSPPVDAIQHQLNQVHTLRSCFFKIHFNVILPSVLSFHKWCFHEGL